MNVTWTNVIPGLWRSDYVTKTAIDAVSYVVALADGEIAVVSPPGSADDALFAFTDQFGKVTALVANNVGHDLGQELWQKRYPDSVTYAPEVAVAKIAKAKKALRPIQPLSALQNKLPPNVRFVDVAGTTSGMTVFSVDAGEGGRALFVDEIISNSPTLIGPLPFKFIFWLTGSGPGLARSKVWTALFAKDKAGVARTVLAEIDRLQPTVVLPGHGNPILPEQFSDLRALLTAIA